MSEIKVNSIKGVGASTAAITVNNTDGTCTANLTNKSNRNLIINGAMLLAQRGTSSTSAGYQTVDRFTSYQNGLDEAPTYSQGDTSQGTSPRQSGFRKTFKIQNGNQTSGAGADDHIVFEYRIEDQDLANSGWDYPQSSSNITLQFWVKSSVAQNFYFMLQSDNGSVYRYVMETGSLSADTWTKITKTIPGNSNIFLNNDNGIGMYISWHLFDGTNRTGTRPLNAWAAADNSARTPDQTSTWYTTNDATFEITGVQLEVGDVATDFEHRSFAQELTLCERYYQIIKPTLGEAQHTTNIQGCLRANPAMRTSPSALLLNNSNNVNRAGSGFESVTSLGTIYTNSTTGGWTEMGGSSFTQHRVYFIRGDNYFAFSAEL